MATEPKIETVLSTRDESQAGVNSYRQHLHKLREDVEVAEMAASSKRLKRHEDEAAKAAAIDARAAGKRKKQEVDESGLNNLKKQFGEESAFGMVVKTIGGAGAVAGLTVATSMLKNSAEEAVKLRNELHESGVSGGALVDKIAGLVPVLGQAWQAGRSIRELITGEIANQEKLAKAVDFTTAVYAKRREELSKIQELTRATGREADAMANVRKAGEKPADIARANSQNQLAEFDRTSAEAQNAFKAAHDDMQRNLAAERRKLAASSIAAIQVAQARGEDAAPLTADFATKDQRLQSQAENAAKTAAGNLKALQTEQARKRVELVKQGEAQIVEAKLNAIHSEEAADRALLASQRQAGEELRAAIVAKQANLTAAEATSLRTRGRDLEASLVEIRAGSKREIAAIEHAADIKAKTMEAVGRIPGLGAEAAVNLGAAFTRQQATEAAAAKKALGDAQEMAAVQADAYRKADQAVSLKAQARQIEIDGLQQVANLGDRQAALEAERLQIAEQFAAKRQEILKTLEREKATLTPEQQASLRQSLGRLTGQEAAAQYLVDRRPGSPLSATSLIDGGSSSGVGRATAEQAQASQAQDQLDTLKQIRDTLKAVEDLPKLMTSFNDFMQRLGLAQPI